MTKIYQDLISEPLEYLICRYGKTYALGLKGEQYYINRAHTLFCNYDKVSKLHYLSPEFAYLTISPERLRAAIKLYLHVNLLHSREVGSYSTWDEDTGEYNLVTDDKGAEVLAAHDADLFMSSLKTKSFMPTDRASAAHEYSMT